MDKLSISLEPELAADIRAAAAEAGLSVSTFLGEAAQSAVRRRRLGAALRAMDDELGELDPAEIERLVAESRSRSIVIRGSGPAVAARTSDST